MIFYFKLKIKAFVFFLFRLQNQLYVKRNKKRFTKRVAIISSDAWQGKLREDWYLKDALNHELWHVDILSWQKPINYEKYEGLIIKSVWGYNQEIKTFRNWLDNLNEQAITVINELSLIRENLDKEQQFITLDRYEIPHIPTHFFYNDSNIIQKIEILLKDTYESIVIKPSISESGNQTYFIGPEAGRKNSIKITDIKSLYEKNEGPYKLMVQPFRKEIDEGEIALTVIDGQLISAILRSTNIFNDNTYIKEINVNQLDDKLKEIAQNIIKIPEFRGALFMRLDFIKTTTGYLVMEVELLDPQLFLNYINNAQDQKQAFTNFAQAIIKKINK